MKNLIDFINESIVIEAVQINSINDPKFNEFLEYIAKYSKSLKIQNAEKKRYEAKGNPITKEIAQDLLSKRLYNNVSVRYTTDPDFFLDVCKQNNIELNAGNLGFGKLEVSKWNVVDKNTKIAAKDIYFDDADVVWVDKTVGFKSDDGGIEMLPDYADRAEEVLSILKKKYKYDDWYIK